MSLYLQVEIAEERPTSASTSIFGGEDELLTLRHDSLSRRSFMGGVLLALRRVGGVDGTVIGLENLLD